MTHICVGNLIIIGSDNGLSPGRRQAITWTNVGILLIGPLGTNFGAVLIEIHTFSFKKIHLKMSGKWRPFCLGLNELRCGYWQWGFTLLPICPPSNQRMWITCIHYTGDITEKIIAQCNHTLWHIPGMSSFNQWSLRPKDAIWWHRSGSTLVHVMAWHQAICTYHQRGPVTIIWAQFHKRHLNHHWLKFAWKLPEKLSEISFQSPRGQWGNPNIYHLDSRADTFIYQTYLPA